MGITNQKTDALSKQNPFESTCNPLFKSDYKNYYKNLMDTVKLSEETRRIAIMSRHAAQQRRHPMAGGINPCYIDRSLDYQEFRHDLFGKMSPGLPMSCKILPN